MKPFQNTGFAPIFATEILPFEGNDLFSGFQSWVNI